MKFKKVGMAVMFFAAMSINAAVIFEDDFSSGANSNLKWNGSLNNYISHSFIDGSCKVINSDNSAYGCVPQKPLSNKPETFTVTCKITFVSDSAQGGLGVCFDQTDYTNHYVSLKSDNTVLVFKSGMGAFPMPCSYMNSDVNELKVSKSDSTFNVFINGHYFTTFTDSRRASGDLALIASAKSTVLFDDVVLTNEFENGTKPTVFEDGFDNTGLVGWVKQINKGTAEVVDGKLQCSVQNDTDSYFYLIPDVRPSDACSVSMEVSHISGPDNRTYGFILYGADINVNRAMFGVSGNRLFVATAKTTGDTLRDGSSCIKGKAYTDPGTGEKTLYIDTLSIIKHNGSNSFTFLANNDTLTTLRDINFSVTSVGIYCSEDLQISVDNFVVNDLNPVSIADYRKIRRQPVALNRSNSMVFDVLGRAVLRSADLKAQNRIMGQGIYINKKELINIIGR